MEPFFGVSVLFLCYRLFCYIRLSCFQFSWRFHVYELSLQKKHSSGSTVAGSRSGAQQRPTKVVNVVHGANCSPLFFCFTWFLFILVVLMVLAV